MQTRVTSIISIAFMRELLTGLSTSAVTLGEVTTLNHKVLDNTVEGGPLVAKALLASGQSAEVLNSLGDRLAVQTDDDAAERLVALGDVEEDLVRDLGALSRLDALGEEDGADTSQNGGGDEKTPEVEHCDDC